MNHVAFDPPGSKSYADATSPHNTSARQTPAFAARVRSAADAVSAVRQARASGLRVVPQATGHGAGGTVGPDTVLVDTSGLDVVVIDPDRRVATVGAGATWGRVNAAAGHHGLVGLSGSAASVSVAGYTFGGGVGWLTRSHGLASASLISVEFVDGSGRLRTAADDAPDPTDRDAIWLFRGGGGVGIATTLTFSLYPIHDLWAGYLLWPIDRLADVLASWRRTLPEFGASVATSLSVLHAPPGPPFPESLQGQPVVHLAVASPAGPAEATALLGSLETVEPTVNTWGPADVATLAQIHLDPPMAVPALGDARWLGEQTLDVAEDALRLVAAPDSPLALLELRNVSAPRSSVPGAQTSVPAPFLMHTVGLATADDSRAAVERALTAVREAFAPADIGHGAASLAEGRSSAPDALDPADRQRVVDITAALDPDGLFHRTRLHPRSTLLEESR
ncbi:MAG: FAD-binding oxidoreductase [Propionibacteriaceae bacterium]